VIVLVLLGGCGAIGLTDREGKPPGDVEDVVLTIEGIDPSWGPLGEDTEITITGPGVGTATDVKVGNTEGISFSVVDDTTLLATVPAYDAEAVVAVRVVGSAGTDTVADGFTYANEAPADTDTDVDSDTDSDADTDADTDTDTSGRGKTGGVIQFGLVQYACTACYDPAMPAVSVVASGTFHDPTRDGWLDWLPAEGDCVNNPSTTAPTDTFLDGGRWLYLTSGSRSVAMQSDSTNTYTASDLDEGDFVRNAAYDVSLANGGDDLDPFDVGDGLQTPQAISELTPVELLYTNPSQAFSARIARSGPSFTWGPTGGGGSFVIELGVYSGSSGAPLGSVVCRGTDNGRMSLPSSALSSYPTGSLVEVGLYRYVIGSFERPDNSSTVETTALFGVIGTGILTP
jgi:hypothetical protein